MEKIERRKPYLYDGSGVIGLCNFCGKRDIAVPTGTLHLCLDCIKRGEWHHRKYVDASGMESRIKIIPGYGTCDICGVLAIGFIAAVEGWACFRCLWMKIAKRNDALRPEGYRIV